MLLPLLKKTVYVFFFIFFSGFIFSSECENLKNFQSSGLKITKASISSSKPNLPIFCKIKGEIKPNIGFEARFPIKQWNGKFFQAGCGGFCGLIEPDRVTQSNAINHALIKGYATITTNGGHQGKHLGDAVWAKNNKEAEEVYIKKLAGRPMLLSQFLYTDFKDFLCKSTASWCRKPI